VHDVAPTPTSAPDLPRRRLLRDAYSWTALALVGLSVLLRWRWFVESHEAIYFLGSKHVADPQFLARDPTWMSLPPVTFLHDYMLAPLWSFMNDLGVAALGRFVMWILFAFALSSVARLVRFPPWSVVVGFGAWLLAEQTVMVCGAPLEGFQPKSFAYPCLLFAMASAMRGQVIRAGALAGLGTAFHLVVGGWGCLALFVAMAASRGRYRLRDLALFVAAAAPFILPVVVATWWFVGDMTAAQAARFDQIYVTFAWPICLDPAAFLTMERALIALLVFITAPVLLWHWSESHESRFLTKFVLTLIAVFALGLVGWGLGANAFLKLFPFQLANALPVLLLLILCLAHCLTRGPSTRFLRVVWISGIVGCLIFADQKDVSDRALRLWQRLVTDLALYRADPSPYGNDMSEAERRMYAWIRRNTPRDAVFITPYVSEFWSCAERAQVAGFRHPPYNHRFLDWYDRLIELNHGKPFIKTGHNIREEFEENQGMLSRQELVHMHEAYGATHYMTSRRRRELDEYRVHEGGKWFIYDVTRMSVP
jgi:hypothetical protein